MMLARLPSLLIVLLMVLGCLRCDAYTCNQFRNTKMSNWYINAGAEDDMGPCIYMPCTMGFWKYNRLQWTVFDVHACNNASVVAAPAPPPARNIASVAFNGTHHHVTYMAAEATIAGDEQHPDDIFKCCLYGKSSDYDIPSLHAVGFNPYVHMDCDSSYEGLPIIGSWGMQYTSSSDLYKCIFFEYSK